MHDYVNEFLAKVKARDGPMRPRPAMRMCTGIVLSIQASRNHYSTPKANDMAEYSEVEVRMWINTTNKFGGREAVRKLWPTAKAILDSDEIGAKRDKAEKLYAHDWLFPYVPVINVNRAIEYLGAMYTIEES